MKCSMMCFGCIGGVADEIDNVELKYFGPRHSQILERVKPDRVTVTKPEEDRRRRTIIVEKCNDSFGFTLQSYGIHYKKEQEIEMITYVDYVEYDGPAYRAGMREGDVILSINGRDMEKTDHKTLVNFIKNCDNRMRMVVLFEDCVRKVELHMRYIHLQRLLQAKMSELERLTVREREVMEGKWKTHSLPARKKGAKQPSESSSPPYELGEVLSSYCRPTMSTEDVAQATPPPGFGPPLILAYRHRQPTYVDQHGRPYVIQPPHSSREYVQAWSSSNYLSRPDQSKGVVRRCSASGILHDSRGYHQSNGIAAATPSSTKPPKVKGSSSGSKSHHCNPCMTSAATSPQDNTSLEAYDLASPCCNSHCVPSRRRRHHHKPKKSSSVESNRGCEWKEKTNNSSSRSRGSSGYISSSSTNNQNAASSHHHHHRHHHHQSGRRYLNLVSQCSLHSCTSSEVNSGAEKAIGNDSSAASYTTSLSTDTLYWEPCQNDNTMARTHSIKSNSSLPREPTKPKSWDNLTTKAFGGYGFGYGYIDRGLKSSQSTKSSRKPPKFVQPTKSSESLLLLPEYPGLSESSLSCECLEAVASPSPVPSEKCHFYTMPPQIETFYHRDKASQTERRQFVNVIQAPEITRL